MTGTIEDGERCPYHNCAPAYSERRSGFVVWSGFFSAAMNQRAVFAALPAPGSPGLFSIQAIQSVWGSL